MTEWEKKHQNTAESDRKSRQMARRLIQKNPAAIVLVTGCSAQGGPEAFAAIEGVSAVVGNREKLRVAEIARELMETGKPQAPIVEVPDLTGADFESMSITRFASGIPSASRSSMEPTHAIRPSFTAT